MVQFSLKLKIFSKIFTNLGEKLTIAPSKFSSSTTKDYLSDIMNKKNYFSHSTYLKMLKKFCLG